MQAQRKVGEPNVRMSPDLPAMPDANLGGLATGGAPRWTPGAVRRLTVVFGPLDRRPVSGVGDA